MSQLSALKRYTTIVADTGDIEAIRQHRPQDATTNPSLLRKAAVMSEYRGLVEEAHQAALRGPETKRIETFMDHLAVGFGAEILGIVPGRVSTEVDAKHSFDEEATVQKARALIELYAARGIEKQRVLIKVGATWEGIRAAARLEKEDIHCNLTLLFSFAQAVACADAGVTLISPFVGRIYDWHRRERGVDDIPVDDDPGVQSVARIYSYYKTYGYTTEVMGASFRKAEQVTALAGCDLLTISPELLLKLEALEGDVPRQLDPKRSSQDPRLDDFGPSAFRWAHNQDPMAVEKLSEGIRKFDQDARALEAWARENVFAS